MTDRDTADRHGPGPGSGGRDALLDRLAEELAPDINPVRLLGRSDVAAVYLAREPALRRLVTVKLLAPGLAGDERARRRFAREAQAAARVSHPNVVAVHRVGALRDGLPYIVMEFVRGRDLAAMLRAVGPLPVEEATRILIEVASALGAAHARRVVHRDIRPANILIEEESGRARVVDFGIAAVLASGDEEPTRLTTVGHVLGHPEYTSPECLRGEEPTEEADVYSLGIVGYALLAGRGPFDAASRPELAAAHLEAAPRPLAELRPDAGPMLAGLLLRCLAKRPEHRPRAVDVARLLVNLAPSEDAAARGSGGGGYGTAAEASPGREPTAPAAPTSGTGAGAFGVSGASPAPPAAGALGPSAAHRFHLRVLGGLELRDSDGRRIMSVLSQPKRVALLTFLAIRCGAGGFERRDSVLGVFWPETDEERGRHSLRQSVYVLRRALGIDVCPSRGEDEIGVDADLLWCDAAAFDEAARAGNPRAALELYRGPLLPGFFLPDADEFERWLDAERRRLERTASEAAWRLAGEREQASDAPAAVHWGRRAVDLAPLDETALRRLIELLARLGDRAGALHAYDRFARRLESEFGAEPAPETQRLVESVRGG